MKKQLTIFAATAMLASFATAAFAATPNISVTGKFLWDVEYEATKDAYDWNNKADNKNTADWFVKAEVPTTGNPNLGTMTFEIAKNGATGNLNPDITMTGTIKTTTLKLGQNNANWEGLIANTDGAGAGVTQPMGNITLDAVSTAKVVNAAKVNVKLSDTNNVYGGAVLTPENSGSQLSGLAFVGGNVKAGPATITGKFLAEIGDDVDPGTSVYGKAEITPTAATKITAKVAMASGLTYTTVGTDGKPVVNAHGLLNYNTDTSVANRDRMDTPGYVAKDQPDELNLFTRAEYTLVKDTVVPYAEYESWADDTYKAKAGTSYKTLFVNDAFVSVNQAKQIEAAVLLAKSVAGIDLEAEAGYRINSEDNANPSDARARFKASHKFDWLSTWGQVEKTFDTTSPSVKLGASAEVSF